MCCFHMDIAPTGEGCKGLPGWLGPLFSTFARLTEGGGGLKLFGQCPYRTNTFQKGTSLTGGGRGRVTPAIKLFSTNKSCFFSSEIVKWEMSTMIMDVPTLTTRIPYFWENRKMPAPIRKENSKIYLSACLNLHEIVTQASLFFPLRE